MDVGERLCVAPGASLSKGSRDVVVSLITDDPLVLTIEALSKEVWAGGGTILDVAEIPEIDEAPERNPSKWSLDNELETGRRSGKREFTMVIRSEGLRTRYGWTSTVSLKEVMDLAGKSLALDLDGRFERKRAMMFMICSLIAGGVDVVVFLCKLQQRKQGEMSG